MLTSAGLFPRRGLQQYELFLRLNSRMTREYSPAHTFNGPALLVRCATESAAGPDPRRAARDLGWSQWVTGEVTVVDAPGDHLDMIRTPAVAAVGAAVRDALARVDR